MPSPNSGCNVCLSPCLSMNRILSLNLAWNDTDIFIFACNYFLYYFILCTCTLHMGFLILYNITIMSAKFKNLPDQYLQSNPNKTINQPSQIFPLSQQQFTIGRTHDNSLQILDNTISKKHAKIALLKGSYYVYDIGSANGVYVNGEKIQGQCKLEAGDSVQFGKYPCLYKFIDKNSAARNRSKGKSKINLKDYLFEENTPQLSNNKSKNQNQMIEQQSVLTQPKEYSKMQSQGTVQSGINKRKVKPKQSKIKIPNLADYLKLASTSNDPLDNQTVINNRKPSPQQKFTRSKVFNNETSNAGTAKQGRVKLSSLQKQSPNQEDLKQYRLEKRERNIYIQEQQALQNIEKQKRRIEQQKLKKQLQQAKIAEDLLQKQLLLQQKVREQQEKVQQEKLKLQEQFVRRQQIKRQQQLRRIKQMEQKQRQMMGKIQQERIKQLQQLKIKQETIKQQSQNQYKNEYQKRKKQLEIQAEALARQYQNIYRQTIRKVRTQIDNQQGTIQKMEEAEQKLQKQSSQLDDQIQIMSQELSQTKNKFIQISGRNKACLLYASDIQDKIDALGSKQFRQNQQGYYRSTTGFNQAKSTAIKKLEESVLNSRKLLKIKEKQYQNVMEEIRSLSTAMKQREYSTTSDVADYLDTILQNLQTIQKLKEEYLEMIQSERAVQEVWDTELQQNNELSSKNRMLEGEITKNIRQIDQNSRDQIKKSTQQRLHMLKVMHFCPEPKKHAARFLIEEMLNIQQEIHKFRMSNQQTHRKIGKIIAQTQKYKRQNQYLSQILFSQDQNGHHFDNMKIVITNLMQKIAQQKNVDNVADCLQMTREAMKTELMIQSQLQRKKKLREQMRKIGQLGIAPGQIKVTQKNPLAFFGDLLTTKQIQIQKRNSTINHFENETNKLKNELRLLQQKKSKISQALQKYKVQQLSEAKKYLNKDGYR